MILNDDDLTIMPPDLPRSMETLHPQHLSMRTDQSFQVAHPVPAVVDSPALLLATMHAVQGLYDAQHLQKHARVWFNNRSRNQVTATRISVLMMIIEAKRLDLLEAVLAVPGMSPSDKDLGRHKIGSYAHRRSIFNGACQNALVRPLNAQGPGAVFVEQCKSVNLSSLSDSSAPWLNGFTLQDHLEHVGAERIEIQNRQSKMLSGKRAILMRQTHEDYAQQIVGSRHVADTNLVGFAVMHGWVDGLLPLLEHRFSPYAHQDGAAYYGFALVLACVFNEPACAKVLLEHPSFDPMSKFGDVNGPTSITGLWNILAPQIKGGYDWDLLWRSPVQQDPSVLTAMVQRWEGLKKTSQNLLLHDPMVHRGVEAFQLRQAASALPIATHDARPRSRL